MMLPSDISRTQEVVKTFKNVKTVKTVFTAWFGNSVSKTVWSKAPSSIDAEIEEGLIFMSPSECPLFFKDWTNVTEGKMKEACFCKLNDAEYLIARIDKESLSPSQLVDELTKLTKLNIEECFDNIYDSVMDHLNKLAFGYTHSEYAKSLLSGVVYSDKLKF